MSRLYKRYRASTWSFDALCAWLSSMSARGYFLHSVKGHCFYFTKNAPCELEYHVEYISANVNDAINYTQLCGWNYVCSDSFLHFFSCRAQQHYYTGAFYKRSCYNERKRFFKALMLSDGASVAICALCCGLIAPKLSSTLTYVLFFLVLLIGLFCLYTFINNLAILKSIDKRIAALPKPVTPSSTAFITKPDNAYDASFLEACLAYKNNGGMLYDISTLTDAHNLIHRLNKASEPSDGFDPFYTYWLIDNGTYIGSANLRLTLNGEQARMGGNIAYEIRPEMRLRGYGTIILDKMLTIAAQKGLENVILTCEADNISAVNTIENCGGRLTSIHVANLDGNVRPTRIYTVSLRNRADEKKD